MQPNLNYLKKLITTTIDFKPKVKPIGYSQPENGVRDIRNL